MTAHLSQVAIVLFQPQDVVNVAAVIRVMSNFGLPHLRIVEPAAFDPYRIEGIAHGTRPIADATRRFSSLAEALADCSLVLGTTGRPRHAVHRIFTPREAAAAVTGPDSPGAGGTEPRIALLFGRETDGLPNEALDLCHGIITIPTHPDNRSLNLAQAALVVCYELWMAATGPAAPYQAGESPALSLPDLATPNLASFAEREALFAALDSLLTTLYPGTTEARLTSSLSRLRTLLMRAAPRQEEAAALSNLLRHAVRELSEKSV